MVGPHLTRLQREVDEIVERIRALEELSVKDTDKLLKKSPRWVRANLPVIVYGPRSRHVRVVDIEAFQQKRTVPPGVFGKKAA